MPALQVKWTENDHKKTSKVTIKYSLLDTSRVSIAKLICFRALPPLTVCISETDAGCLFQLMKYAYHYSSGVIS